MRVANIQITVFSSAQHKSLSSDSIHFIQNAYPKPRLPKKSLSTSKAANHTQSKTSAMSSKELQTYTRPSTLATRSLVSDTTSSVSSTTSPTTSDATSPTSTNNYAQAVAAARPAALDRQQSWTKDDLKRAHVEALLEEKKPGLGYSSTSADGGVAS